MYQPYSRHYSQSMNPPLNHRHNLPCSLLHSPSPIRPLVHRCCRHLCLRANLLSRQLCQRQTLHPFQRFNHHCNHPSNRPSNQLAYLPHSQRHSHHTSLQHTLQRTHPFSQSVHLQYNLPHSHQLNHLVYHPFSPHKPPPSNLRVSQLLYLLLSHHCSHPSNRPAHQVVSLHSDQLVANPLQSQHLSQVGHQLPLYPLYQGSQTGRPFYQAHSPQ